MPDTARPSTRLEPALAWTVLTDSPLAGLSLAREAGMLLAWDDDDRLYVLDLNGQRRAAGRAEAKVLAAAISDDGSLVALLMQGSRLSLLGGDLEPIADRAAITEGISLAVDPHGRFAVVASKVNVVQVYNRHGKPAGKFDTFLPFVHMKFIADRPMLIGANSHGLISGIELSDAGGGRIDGEEVWRQQPMSNIGRLTASGDGGMVLASCFIHGVQKFDARGHSEGSYHLGGTASHAVPDFAGRSIAVATTEGEIALLNNRGNVRWKSGLARPVIALEIDALGRFLIYGQATGEITRLNIDGTPGRSESSPTTTMVDVATGPIASVRRPDWTAPAANSEAQAESAVLAVLDDPPRLGVMTNSNRLQVYTTSGGALGQAPEMMGVGRILRTAPGWIAAATDRMIVLYDARRNGAQRVDLSLMEVTHLAPRPEAFGLAIVQEADRIGRASLDGRWVWKQELKTVVEDLALGPEDRMAITTTDGRLLVYDPTGGTAGFYQTEAAEPLCLIEAPDGSPDGIAWVTLARRQQVLRGHRLDGRVAWESPTPWEGWQLHRVGRRAVVSAPDGRAVAYDGAGHPKGQSRAEDAQGLFHPGPDGEVRRVVKQGVHLICSALSGRVHWRFVADEPLGPLAAGASGVAVMVGKSVAWFNP